MFKVCHLFHFQTCKYLSAAVSTSSPKHSWGYFYVQSLICNKIKKNLQLKHFSLASQVATSSHWCYSDRASLSTSNAESAVTDQQFVGWPSLPLSGSRTWRGNTSQADASPSCCSTIKPYSLPGWWSENFFNPSTWVHCLGAECHCCACNRKCQLLPKVFLMKKGLLWPCVLSRGSLEISHKGKSQIQLAI